MNEFSSLLESYIIKTGSLLIAGDFNFHVDDPSDAVAANFLGFLESFDLRQHVHSYTHRAGHTLDLVISRSAESILNVTSVDDSSIIWDHYTVCADLQFVKPRWERKRIRTRKVKAVDIEQFKQDIGLSPLLSDSSSDLQELQLVDYIDSNGLCEVFQSAYRTNHSTETAQSHHGLQ